MPKVLYLCVKKMTNRLHTLFPKLMGFASKDENDRWYWSKEITDSTHPVIGFYEKQNPHPSCIVIDFDGVFYDEDFE